MSSTRMNRILGRRSACLPASATRAGGALCANAAAPGTVAIAAKLIAAVANNLLGEEKRSGAGAFSEAGSEVVDDRSTVYTPNPPIPAHSRIHISRIT